MTVQDVSSCLVFGLVPKHLLIVFFVRFSCDSAETSLKLFEFFFFPSPSR